MSDYDPVLLEIMKSLLSAVAEEMGGALGRTAFSPNIKERRDYSCAVFEPAGEMVAQAAHIPVHLGAMPLSVAAALERSRRWPTATSWCSTIPTPAARTCRTSPWCRRCTPGA